MFSSVLGVVVDAVTPEVVTNAVTTAGNAANYVVTTVQNGARTVVDGTSNVVSSAVSYLKPASEADKIAQRNDARRIDTPVKRVRELTAEERWQKEKLAEFKGKINTHIVLLNNQLDQLTESCFSFLNRREIGLKVKKVDALSDLKKVTDWASFQIKAKALLEQGGDVTAGRHSVTRDILEGITSTKWIPSPPAIPMK